MTEDAKRGDDGQLDARRAGALAAMKRARQRAEELALATGTDLIEAVDGKPVRVAPRRKPRP